MSCQGGGDVSALLAAAVRGDMVAEEQLRVIASGSDLSRAVCAIAALREVQVRRLAGQALTGAGVVGVKAGTTLDTTSNALVFGPVVLGAIGLVLAVLILGRGK